MLLIIILFVLFQTIYDPACTAGLQSTWGFGNQLFVFPGRKPTLYPGICYMYLCYRSKITFINLYLFSFFNLFIRFFFSLSDFKNFLFNRLIGFFHEIIYRHNNFYEICLVPPIVTMCFMYSCHCVYYAFLSQCVLCILITMCITCMYSCQNVYYVLSQCVLHVCILFTMCIMYMYSCHNVLYILILSLEWSLYYFSVLENQLHCRRLQEIREVRWDIDLYHPVMRKLVNESHSK